MKRMELITGDAVKYKDKVGIFIGLVKHTRRYKGRQLAYVQFKYDKTSKVFYHKLELYIGVEDLEPKTIGNHRSPFGIGS